MTRHWLSFVVAAVIFGTLVWLLAPHATGENFQGATGLLDKLNAAAKAPAGVTTAPDDYIHLGKDIAVFGKQSSSLSPEEAAKQWLALFDRSMALQRNSGQMDNEGGPSRGIFNVLPGPGSWPELQKLVEARTQNKQGNPLNQSLLLLIVHTLNNKEPQQWADLASMGPADKTVPDWTVIAATLNLGNKLSSMSNLPEDVEKFWTRTLNTLQQSPTNMGGMDPVAFELPDLVTILGAAKAEPLVLQALLFPQARVVKIDGLATQRLARKLALAHLDQLKVAPWILTESLEGSALYEALIKKFPGDGGGDAGAIYHVLALVTEGKNKEAVESVEKTNLTSIRSAVNQAAEAGYGLQVYDFLHTLLAAHPEYGCWDSYITLAAQTGHAAEALKFVQDTIAKKDLSNAARDQVLPVLYRALLAVDQVDAGIAELRNLIQITKKSIPSSTPANSSVSSFGRYTQQNGTAAWQGKLAGWDMELARLGYLLKRPSLEAEGLSDVKLYASSSSLIQFLIRTGRYVQAEKLLIDDIVGETTRAKAAAAAQPYDYYGGYSRNQQNLVELAEVYYKTERWNDILTLLEQAPGWSAADLVSIAGSEPSTGRFPSPCLGLMAARALVETGKVDQARPILDYVLQIHPGSDAAYALLLKIGQGDLVAKLDTLYQQDQFENRPLIWKATVLLQQGKIAEAEQACKAAIVVDPSDGETGKDDRMRVYSVMADICEAKKDTQQATFFHNVVKAIRLSENADDYYDAGLLTHAVGMYAQALDLFSDAYCIQSRLARQLAELGRIEEASVHYRKAFELMPVSFGRMESHCFGCERAFEGKTAVDIAQKTFTDMLAKDPKKPQLYYLLGYLEKEQELYPEALENFHKAAELDPDYINAWRKIMEIGQYYQLNPTLGDEAVFNVLRLDPTGRHVTVNTQNVRQLAKLWAVEEACAKAVLPVPTTLYPLKTSALEQTALKEKMKKMIPAGLDPATQDTIEEEMVSQLDRTRKQGTPPREAVLQNGVLSNATNLFR